MKPRLFTGLMLFALLGVRAIAAPSQDPEQAPVLTLAAAVRAVLSDNPGLAAMRARAVAAAAVPDQVATLPDPSLQLNAINLPLDSLSLSQEGMTQLQVGVVQVLPYPGKLDLRREEADYDGRAARWEVEERRLKLVRDVKTVWWNLFYLDRALEILARNRQLLRQLVDVAQTKYKVGQGLQQDVLLAQLETSKLLDQKITLQGARRNVEARLNALLNRPTRQVVHLPARVPVVLAEPGDEPSLQAQALKQRPVLAVQKNGIAAARVRLKLAKKDYYPDFKLGALYGLRSGGNPDGGSRADFASLTFSMNMPLFTGKRQDKRVDQRNSQLLQSRYGLDDARDRVAMEVSQAMADYGSAREQALLLDGGIIPQARQTVASMLAAYQVDKVDFLNLVRTQITLFNYETRYWRAVSSANQAQAALQAAVGDSSAADFLSSRPESEVPHE